MQVYEGSIAPAPKRTPWNKGKLIGAKPPLWPKHVWSIRTKLHIEGRILELALFNVAIDSKLRGCDVVALKVEDVAPNGHAVAHARCVRKSVFERAVAPHAQHRADFWTIRAELHCSARVISDLDFFSDGEGVVHLDTEVPHCTFNLGVAEQELHRT
jgi:hypothetical protein